MSFAFAQAQQNVPVNGPHATDAVVHAFVHAVVHPAPGEEVRNATLIIQGDHIIAVGVGVEVPQGAVVHDLAGAHIWPALIDAYSDLGMPTRDKAEGPRAAATERTGPHYWNTSIHADMAAAELYVPDEERATKLREQGVGLVLTHRMDGIARGTGTALLLAGKGPREDILLPSTAQYFSFRKGSAREAYPSSLTGSIALLRQALYDAQWYLGNGAREASDLDLAALNRDRSLPHVFEAEGRNDELRIAALGKEFDMHFIVRGKGDEYARLNEIIAAGQSLILPLTLPEALDVEDPFEALEVSIAELKHWELAPFNAGRLDTSGVPIAFTLQGLKEPGDLWANLRRMVRCGLDSTAAIAALTTAPAQWFHLEDRVGALRVGMLANFMITSDHLLSAKNTIHETWVAGERFQIKAVPGDDLRGTYDLNLKSSILKLQLKGEPGALEAEVYRASMDTVKVKAALNVRGDLISLNFPGEKLGFTGPVRLNGIAHADGGIWDGQGLLPGGDWLAWTAVRQNGERIKEPRKPARTDVLDSLWSLPPGEVWEPFGAFGTALRLDSGTVFLHHATVWTNTAQGVLYDTDVCIHQGRILAVGKGLEKAVLFPKTKIMVREIDARGKHLTCGIIDEHSHIAIDRGVNEGGQAISAEVRMSDVIDPDNVDIYRNLAGGVTAIQQLHGSANPIGGQSSLIKLRWGQPADGLRIAGAPGFIKFALGENVKQGNGGGSDRYPQTRMGVEQTMYEAFLRARAYGIARKAFAERMPKPAARAKAGKGSKAPAASASADMPRRDLELDALLEILDGQRFITCHSYVQSEILMLMRVADSLGFRINTFTHILEGYKVAAEMKEHGVTASTFSDWWAYKYEVNDAIPYNAALLHDAGVNVCINSDDAEMSRRLNQEAAKVVKYGGVSEAEAWKMVTLNPAKALHLDGRMGTVEPGKDADLVLWSTSPLSIDAHCEMTFVDGVAYFDLQRDLQLRTALRAERERIIAKMIAARKAGAPVRKAARRERGHWTCETMGEEP